MLDRSDDFVVLVDHVVVLIENEFKDAHDSAVIGIFKVVALSLQALLCCLKMLYLCPLSGHDLCVLSGLLEPYAPYLVEFCFEL